MPEKLSEDFKMQLWDKAACGRHGNRYGEDDSVYDMTCNDCTKNFVNLRDFAERIVELEDELKQAKIVEDESDRIRIRLAQLLTQTADALHGTSHPNGFWSWHDLPEIAKDMFHKVEELGKPLPKNPLCKGDGNCNGVCGACLELTTNLEFRLAHELVRLQGK